MKKFIIPGIIVAILAVIGISGYNYANSLNSEIVERETSLTKSYKENQGELDSYVKGIVESTGIANVKSDKLTQILRDAVSGRYGDDKGEIGAKQGQGGSFFSAIVEAYPDIRGQMDVYDRIVDKVFAGREAFKGKQNALLGEVQKYKVFINDGLVRRFFVQNILGAPTELLEANTGKGRTLTGKAALEQMQLIVTSKRTNDAFDSGEEDAIEIPGAKK